MRKRWLRWLVWVAITAAVLCLGDRLPWRPPAFSPTAVLQETIQPASAQTATPEVPPPPSTLTPEPDTPVTSPPLTEPMVPSDWSNPDAQVSPIPEPTNSTMPTDVPPAGDLAPLPLPESAADLTDVSPLPVTNTYIDANARFRVGILQGYRVSPLAGSVLIEAPDGVLAYTVIVQPVQRPAFDSQPLDNFALAQVAQAALARGEGFASTAIPVDLPRGGVQVNWSGRLTIAGQTQPVQGVILARQAGDDVLLLLIAGAQAGIAQIPNAVAALVDTFQPFL
ncbi:hypothetical protein [Trichothermofontia sp.]